MRRITKSIFLESFQCLTRGWFLRSQDQGLPPSEGDLLRIELGTEVGRLARLLYPEGLLLEGTDFAETSDRTARLIHNASTASLFEPAFAVDQYVTKADILERCAGGWHVIEVKASLEDTSSLDALTDDLCYSVMVAKRWGLRVEKASLLLMSRDYRHGMPVDRMFVERDRTTNIWDRLPDFDAQWDSVQKATSGASQPDATLISLCKKCEFFESECLGCDVANPIHSLPRLSSKRLAELRQQGVREVGSVPDGFPLSDIQQRAVACVRSGDAFYGPTLNNDLEAVVWPAHYLDFESVMTALPLYPNTGPYEQILTQYSIHRCARPGQIDGHSEFLAEHTHDCRRKLTEQLIADLSGAGSIVVYSQFESARIGELIDLFPDLKDDLDSIVARIFDLLPVIREGYYDPGFRGSFSIKSVLPILVPELSYQALAISNGDTAIAQFARLAMGQIPEEGVDRVRQDLLEYCRLDTLAMVRLHERLLELSDSVGSGLISGTG